MSKETLNYQYYMLSKRFIDNKGFFEYWKTMYNYYIGKQYENSRDPSIPKPMTNLCRFIVDSKVSKIIGTPYSLNFSIFSNTKSSVELQNFDKYMLSRLQEEEFNYQACENGYTFGTEITYYRWDKDDTTVDGRYIGGLAVEHIEPSHFRVANPYLNDIQKQEWVMFFNSETVGSVKEMVDKEEIRKQITPDGINDEELNRLTTSDINSRLVTVYTRFFRLDGEVYYQLSTETVDLTDCIPMNPSLKPRKLKIINNLDDREIADYEIDNQDMIANITEKQKSSDSHYSKTKAKFNLYPFAIYCPRPLKNSIYGKSEIEELIPNQKYVNRLDSMILLEAMNTGMGKTVVKKDALKGQKITNDPRQVIVDNSMGQGFGIKRLEPAVMNTSVVGYNENFIARTRNINGADEISPSVATTKNLSGVAIQLINEEKNTQIEQAQRRFWNYCVNKAYIRLQFYKHYYAKIKYVVTLTDREMQQEMAARALMIRQDRANGIRLSPFEYPVPKKEQIRSFDPSEIKDDTFDISIEAGRGVRWSGIIEADMLNNLVLNGGLQNMDYHTKELFFNLYPLISPSFKNNFNMMLEKQKNDEISQANQQISQLAQQIEQLTNYTRTLENKLGVQSEYTKNLEKEFVNKINAQNDIISTQNKIISGRQAQQPMAPMPSAETYTE